MAKLKVKSPSEVMSKMDKKGSPGKYDGKGDGVWSQHPRSSNSGAPEKFYDTVGPFGKV